MWIDHGILKQLAYDRFTAKAEGVETIPTLEAPALSIDGLPAQSIQELMKNTERAILVTNFWYIRPVNPRDLMLTGMTRDGTFLVEKGEIVSAVRNFRFHDSPLQAFRHIAACTTPMEAVNSETGKMLVPALALRIFVSQASHGSSCVMRTPNIFNRPQNKGLTLLCARSRYKKGISIGPIEGGGSARWPRDSTKNPSTLFTEFHHRSRSMKLGRSLRPTVRSCSMLAPCDGARWLTSLPTSRAMRTRPIHAFVNPLRSPTERWSVPRSKGRVPSGRMEWRSQSRKQRTRRPRRSQSYNSRLRCRLMFSRKKSPKSEPA